MDSAVTILDKQFIPYISETEIQKSIISIAKKINTDLKNDVPVFLVILNGAFMFASDLLKEITIPCEICFIKVASYQGFSSSGKVTELIGLTTEVFNRTVVIVEDIVDTGTTIEKIIELLENKKVKQIKIASALFKKVAYKKTIPIHYVGIEIKNEFVVGYGLDYMEQGRNLKEIYILA